MGFKKMNKEFSFADVVGDLHDGAKRARFTNIVKNKFDCWYRQAAY